MTALVTGAGGFVGSHLVKNLADRGKKPTCVIWDKSDKEFINTTDHNIIRGDIRDQEFVRDAVSGHDQIYHLAALLNHAKPTADEFFKTNVLGTRNIMRAALEEGVDKVVYTSSRVTLDEDRAIRLDEATRHPDFFNNAYTMSKYKGEKVVLEYGSKGLDVNTVHPTLIYGPGETNTLAPLMRTYLHPPIRFKGYTDSVFDFVYVGDVAEGHVAAMEKGIPGERYVLGGEERTIGEFLDLLDELTSTRKPSITVPQPLVEFGAMKIGPILEAIGFDLPIQRDQVHAMRSDTKVDNTKMQEELEMDVTPLREGLEKQIKWLRKQDLLHA